MCSPGGKRVTIVSPQTLPLGTGRPEGLPHLAKMARQFLGRPATSAGVERMLSDAGRMHDDMRAAQTDGTLQHALLAAANAL
jgi:hypothetical protein